MTLTSRQSAKQSSDASMALDFTEGESLCNIYLALQKILPAQLTTLNPCNSHSAVLIKQRFGLKKRLKSDWKSISLFGQYKPISFIGEKLQDAASTMSQRPCKTFLRGQIKLKGF